MNTLSSYRYAAGDVVRRATGFQFTEGPVWDREAGVLIFSDIPRGQMHAFDPRGETTRVYRAPSHKANGHCFDLQGRLVSCEHATSRVVRQERDGALTVIASHYEGHELNSPNDVVVDARGRLYFTDPAYGRTLGAGTLLNVGVPRPEPQPVRGVYRVDPEDGAILRIAEDFEAPNGLCLADDGATLFINDSERRHIRRFDVLEHGLSGGEVWAVPQGAAPGVPDGMKIDAQGHLCCTGPGGVHVFDRDANLLAVIEVPEVVGNFNWGDPDLRTLYLCATSSLYSCRVDIPGPGRGAPQR